MGDAVESERVAERALELAELPAILTLPAIVCNRSGINARAEAISIVTRAIAESVAVLRTIGPRDLAFRAR